MTDSPAAIRIREAATALGLTIDAKFVPFSQSRNAVNDPGNKPGSRSLNWRVTLERNGREVLTTDYSAGVAHCPSYKHGMRWTLDNTALIVHETEKGRAAMASAVGGGIRANAPIHVDAAAFIASLVLDAGVIDFASFEDWASELGYDPDSRSAEKIYRSCLEIALKLRAAIGDAGIEALRTACEDY